LLISTELVDGLDATTLGILTAPEVLAVSQDALGAQGIRVSAADPTGTECWARPLADGSVAALLLPVARTRQCDMHVAAAGPAAREPGDGA